MSRRRLVTGAASVAGLVAGAGVTEAANAAARGSRSAPAKRPPTPGEELMTEHGLTQPQLDLLAERFAELENKLYGDTALQQYLDRVAGVEEQLGVADLPVFTPACPCAVTRAGVSDGGPVSRATEVTRPGAPRG